MAERVPARLTAAQGRRFAFPVGGAFLALGGILWWRDAPTVASVLGALGGVLLLAGVVAPARLGPVERGWMRLAHAISRVTTPIVMTIAWLLVITPVGLVRRTLGSNPMRHRPTGDGYWKPRAAGARRSDLTRPF